MSDEASEKFRVFACQPERNRGTEGVGDDPRRDKPQMFDQCGEIGHILQDAPLSAGTLTFTVPTAVISNHLKGIG